MGDILSVIEKAEESFDLEQAEKLEKQFKEKRTRFRRLSSTIKASKKDGFIFIFIKTNSWNESILKI